MTYDPEIPRQFYDNLGDREWHRLTKDRLGELLFHVHMDVLRLHIGPEHSVLELGAGAGIFTKELALLAGRLVVSDLSQVQLDLNRQHMIGAGCFDRISSFENLDIGDLSELDAGTFDRVVCIGGPLSYLLDRERTALEGLIRILRPGGRLVVGVMSLLSTVIRYMRGLKNEKESYGIDAIRWLLETGIQDGSNYPGPQHAKHHVHMMRSDELDALCDDLPATIIEKRAAGLLALAGEEALEVAAQDPDLWQLLLDRELAYSKQPGSLDLGANLLYVLEKESGDVTSGSRGGEGVHG
ncbi:MAG: class I SAM-dependent methyltransferase [Candidatus Latescibacteria bacterium]|jgi:SAM-dependent methyltransferase|nr:class I SAM-dependent methyltransferase [Candidatus Latescibacterota bacterium]